ncbi:MAG: hypothetical protein DCF25_09365 [Leptolyngbya foveolarum]|uniref:Uncharacterized protein n=1 Tax=Leptolyngbya foveolarum TaxID=47253 RepID=A0A2W4UCU5_9CYAN|nr:MAG: hypothetical protein DCF25_09365 [Leptolyngbya foveolarum]
MFFEFWKTNRKADNNSQHEFGAESVTAELATTENNMPVKASSAEKQTAEKQSAVEKESSIAEREEAESRKDRLKKQRNSKVECRNPDCTESALWAYDGEFDADGDATVSYLYCLNCGFNFPYFEKFEKAEKKAEDGPNWNAGFVFLVAILFTVIVIKGEQEGQFFNPDASPINNQGESLRSPQSDIVPQGEYPVRILNDAEPFVINNS